MLTKSLPLAAHSARRLPLILTRTYADNSNPANDPRPKPPVQNVSETNALATSSEGSMDKLLQESTEEGEHYRTMQAPNREKTWSKSQVERSKAMKGPRFEQMIMYDQPRPYSAIELIQKQPIRWRHTRTVSCDGGGGPLGHPRVFINLDSPRVVPCSYCGLPFAHEHYKETIKADPANVYPLAPTGDPAEVNEAQKVTDEVLAQR